MANTNPQTATWRGMCWTTDTGHHEYRATTPQTPHQGAPCGDHDWRTTRRETMNGRGQTGEWQRQQCRNCHSTRQTSTTTWTSGRTNACATC